MRCRPKPAHETRRSKSRVRFIRQFELMISMQIAKASESESLDTKINISDALDSPANAQGSNNAGLSVRAATAAAFVPKSKPGTNLHGSSKSNASDGDSLTTSTSRVGVSPSGGSGSAASARPFNPYAAAHVPAATESGRGTPSSGQWETDGSNLSFDPTYMGPLPNATTGGPPGLTPAHQQSGQDQQARAFNPYSHLDQYGQSTTGAASSFDRPRQPPALDHNLHTAPLPHVEKN
ncbi:hypothetical protein CBOM_00956 [Ceraceosorus bombacis]|uniref:Uncharacterized protein n=1 Tax=Ceraceosorus bombacis TaxID=401625 RepID=A0A0P1BAE7_9BASI|nr:hypothetical protein CBOM_00956 [Ceraceosorus bombacis]